MSQQDLRNQFLGILQQIETVLRKLISETQPYGTLTDPELQTLGEGLFLFALTHWEQFTRNLLVEDLATDPASFLHTAIQQFRDPEAARRLAVRLLSHPDHPRKFIEWSGYGDIEKRANELGSVHELFSRI